MSRNQNPPDCEIGKCDRQSNGCVLITDRDGGGGRLYVCKPCENAYKIGKRDK